MPDEHTTPPDSLTRRRFLVGASAMLAGGIAAGIAARRASASVDVPPLPRATSLSSSESPAIDSYHVCLHLACDDESRLADVEAALVVGRRLPGVEGSLPLAPILIWRETRTGWYGKLSAQQRVALMYSPQTTVEAARKFTTDASGNPGAITEAITRYGVIGHAQASAQARRHNRPVIIRRDCDTVDGGYAGLHFVSLQRSIADFLATRNAMNATGAHNVNGGLAACHAHDESPVTTSA